MEIDLQPYAYFEGEIVPADQAKVSIATHALQYGTGAFGGIRGYMDVSGETINIFRLPDHTRRLMNSARILRSELKLDADGLAGVIQDLVAKNNPHSNVYIRPFIYKAGIELTPHLKGIKDEIAIYVIQLDDYFAMDHPLRLMVSAWTRIADNIIPSRAKITGGYINSSLAKDQAAEAGFDDALMLNERGKIAEASGANLFIVRNGTLITSPVNGDILEGITRRTVAKFARDLGIALEEREIDRSELYVADEAFLCGTGAQVAAVGNIDGRPVGNGERGPITQRIQEVFFSCVKGEDQRYGDLLTKVPVRP
ncbi:MAG: branched-chain amino acid transaminase [Thermomicrobiales bacterium]|nr:branched-chain amino acid transaminase [Thermomicrobiales bacterium]